MSAQQILQVNLAVLHLVALAFFNYLWLNMAFYFFDPATLLFSDIKKNFEASLRKKI